MSQKNIHKLDVSKVPHQRDFVTSTVKNTIISGSLGAGKTTPLCIKAFQEALRAPGAKVLMVRKELKAFKESTLNTLIQGDREMPPVIPPEYIIHHNKSEHEIKIRTEGEPSYIVYSGVSKRAGDKYPKKLGSTEFTDIAIDELEELDEADFDYLKGRMRRPKLDAEGNKLRRLIFAATNPGGPNHWAYDRFKISNPEERPDNVRVIRAKTEDNVYLDDEYIQDLKETYTGMMRQRLLLGKWVAAEGQVYQNFDRSVHQKEPYYFYKPEEDWEDPEEPELRDYNKIIVGADSNYAKPRAAVVIGITGTEIHLLDEFYRERTNVDALAEWLKDKPYRIDRIWYDPSEPGEIDSLKKAGFSAEGAPNSIVDGISKVSSKLGNEYSCGNCGNNFSMEKPARECDVEEGCQDADAVYMEPRLFIHPRLSNWKDEVASYKYADDGRRSDEKPVDKNDHLMDATRYGIMGTESGGAGLAFTKL